MAGARIRPPIAIPSHRGAAVAAPGAGAGAGAGADRGRRQRQGGLVMQFAGRYTTYTDLSLLLPSLVLLCGYACLMFIFFSLDLLLGVHTVKPAVCGLFSRVPTCEWVSPPDT